MKKFVLICMLLSIIFSLSGQEFIDPPKLRTQIKLLKQVYRINEPIQVYFTVINTGAKPISINIAEQLYRNFKFRVRTLKNIFTKYRDDYYLSLMRKRNIKDTGRALKLMPGERYGRVIDIAKRFRFVNSDHYEVTGYFYTKPTLLKNDYNIKSNSLRFILRPPLMVQRLVKKYDRKRMKYISKRLSAGETVDFTIKSKRAHDWPNYFRYMDLVKLINVFQNFSKKYSAASFADKKSIMFDFKKFLKGFPVEKIHSHFVKKVIVERDRLTMGENATVECEIVFKQKRLIERKLYYFSLYRRMDRWYIYKYYVVNK